MPAPVAGGGQAIFRGDRALSPRGKLARPDLACILAQLERLSWYSRPGWSRFLPALPPWSTDSCHAREPCYCIALAVLLAGIATVLPAAEPNTLTEEELADGWILLFDGETALRLEGRPARPIGRWPTA